MVVMPKLLLLLVYRSSRLSTIGHQFQRHQLTQQLDVIRRQPAQ
ncbi:hypothetical protein TYRP_014304 [Tyrophagus putrescentiae]|nr:hypothetical protein TYRP_014304 [Tyrophagus putrescentiae]